jgi:hypothetical protein
MLYLYRDRPEYERARATPAEPSEVLRAERLIRLLP